MTQEAAHALAARVVADPLAAKEMTQDQAVAVVAILAAALAAAQAQALRPSATAPAPPSKFTERVTLTTAETAEWTGLEETRVQELCRRGVIPASKPGKAWLIRVEAVREWLATQEQEQRDRRTAPVVAASASHRQAARLDALPKNSRRSV